MSEQDWKCDDCGADATGVLHVRGFSPGIAFCPLHKPEIFKDDIAALRAENDRLRKVDESAETFAQSSYRHACRTIATLKDELLRVSALADIVIHSQSAELRDKLPQTIVEVIATALGIPECTHTLAKAVHANESATFEAEMRGCFNCPALENKVAEAQAAITVLVAALKQAFADLGSAYPSDHGHAEHCFAKIVKNLPASVRARVERDTKRDLVIDAVKALHANRGLPGTSVQGAHEAFQARLRYLYAAFVALGEV